jgi:hypothetical protein
MNMRDAQILNARKKAADGNGYYCNLVTQVHVGCEHGNSLLSSESAKIGKEYRKQRSKSRVASREVQHARYLDCGPQNWDDR